MTLNTPSETKNKISEEDQSLIADYLSKNKVTIIKPGLASNDEISRATREHVAKERRKFNKDKK